MKVYQELARLVDAYHRCKRENNDFAYNHEDIITSIVRHHLPNSSGFTTEIELEKSNIDKLVFDCQYHVMNEVGYYCGYIYFTIVITPSLAYGFNIKIEAYYNDTDDSVYTDDDFLEDFFIDTYASALNEIVNNNILMEGE